MVGRGVSGPGRGGVWKASAVEFVSGSELGVHLCWGRGGGAENAEQRFISIEH